MKQVLVVSLIVVALGGCFRATTPIPSAQSVDAQLYAKKCSACHALPHPKRNTSEQWRNLVPLMERRMAERGMETLTEDERETVLAYLTTHAR